MIKAIVIIVLLVFALGGSPEAVARTCPADKIFEETVTGGGAEQWPAGETNEEIQEWISDCQSDARTACENSADSVEAGFLDQCKDHCSPCTGYATTLNSSCPQMDTLRDQEPDGSGGIICTGVGQVKVDCACD